MSDDKYNPIDCDYHDQLEAAAMHKKEVELEYETSNTTTRQRGTIADVFSREGEEFVKLSAPSGSVEVRLDKIKGFREL